ncbi:MAG: GGDEF domain-containing protein [Elusimicrobia bacterium]|nr:GGDEF domain-containing protein [Elusimicrobiota bacterium]
MKGLERLRSFSVVITAGLAFSALMGLLNFLTGARLDFSIFYLIPVAFVSWFAGQKPGYLVSLVCVVLWFSFDHMILSDVHAFDGFNAVVRFLVLGLVGFLLSKLKAMWEKEKELARLDPLTGIANSRHFFELAGWEINRARRYIRPLTLAYFDLDNFKSVNDRHGHMAGDDLLGIVAQTAQSHVRKTDIVARLGGDEFGILLPETGQKSAEKVIAKVREELLASMQDHGWPVTFSFGVVTFASPPESVDEMIDKADALMYAAKHNGKNQVRQIVLGDRVPFSK